MLRSTSPWTVSSAVAVVGFSLVAFACGDAADPEPLLQPGPTGAGGDSSSASTTTVTTTGAVSVTSSGSGGAFVCDPPAAPGSLFELEDEPLFRPGTQSMCAYRGDVIFMFNAAAL